ncbi:MAG: hypothetical protein IR159_02745 [Brevundimonas sp.]|nr:hypothetical protein [Brevundimonas sp.]
MKPTWKGVVAGAALALLASAAPAAGQTPFDGIPGLTHYGDADGWQVKKLDSDDIWYGQACVIFKNLSAGPNPLQAVYRFEPGEDEVTISFLFPQAQSVPDPEAVDWGYLEPKEFQYAVDPTGVYDISGHVGFEYIDATKVYVELRLDADLAIANRMAAAEQVGVAVKGHEGIAFPTGRATRAVSLARRCLNSFR